MGLNPQYLLAFSNSSDGEHPATAIPCYCNGRGYDCNFDLGSHLLGYSPRQDDDAGSCTPCNTLFCMVVGSNTFNSIYSRLQPLAICHHCSTGCYAAQLYVESIAKHPIYNSLLGSIAAIFHTPFHRIKKALRLSECLF